MFYKLASFSDQIGALNVFRYQTIRAAMAIVTALLFAFLFGPAIIDQLRLKHAKSGTLAMGGLVEPAGVMISILMGTLISALQWAPWLP